MRTHKKGLIVITIILTFLIVAPAVIGIGSGLRVDWKNKRLVKTGAIFLEINRQNALVFLNGELKTKSFTLPFISRKLIQNLIPKDYKVEVMKEGFQPWTKNVIVEEGKTTELKAVLLFPTRPQIETLATNLLNGEILFDDGQIYYLALSESEPNKTALITYNPSSQEKLQEILPLPKSFFLQETLAFFLTAGKDLVFNLINEYFLTIPSPEGQHVKISWPSVDEINQLIPHPLNSRAFYVIAGNRVYFSEIGPNQPEQPFMPAKIGGFAIKDNTIYTFDSTSGALQRWNLLTHQFEGNIAVMDSKNYEDEIWFQIILGRDESEITLLGKNTHQLFIINPEGKNFKKAEERVSSAIFSKDDELIYWQNDPEQARLWVLHLKKKSSEPPKEEGHIDLIGEYSSEILQVTPYEYKGETPYLIVSADKKIFATELDTRNPINKALIVNEPANNFILYENIIYFADQTGNLKRVKLK